MTASTALASFQAELQQELKDLANYAPPPSGNQITTKGKLFTLPDGQASPGPLNAIILDWRYNNSYFEGVYDKSNPQPPVCWAINKAPSELAPSAASPKKQNETCDGCAMDKWKSSPTGKGKACKNVCRLALVPADANEKSKPMIINVSPTALKQWGNYLTRLKTQLGMLPVQVVTEISFNPNESYPSLMFSLSETKVDEDRYGLLAALRAAAQESLEYEPQAA